MRFGITYADEEGEDEEERCGPLSSFLVLIVSRKQDQFVIVISLAVSNTSPNLPQQSMNETL